MGKVITNPKNYTGKELEQIFSARWSAGRTRST